MEIVARAFGAQASVRTPEVIFNNHTKIRNLENLCHIVKHYYKTAVREGIDIQVCDALRGGVTLNRAAIRACIKHRKYTELEVSWCIDASLLVLRHKGKLRMEVNNGDLDDHTTIESTV